jgi:hypothetical protein
MLHEELLDGVRVFVGVSGTRGISSSIGGSGSFCKIAILCKTAVAIIIPANYNFFMNSIKLMER